MTKDDYIFKPKYISFDCYGTLIRFHMTEMVTESYADRLPADALPQFCKDWAFHRLDEAVGAWKPYQEVLRNSLERTSKKWGVEYRDEDADAVYNMVPKWGPHTDVTPGLAKIADKIPLVILSNAMNDQIPYNVELIGVPFHKVLTAQSAQAYKPRMKAFEYMLDQLDCGPEEIMHVSSSFRYDLNTASDLRFGCRVFVGRGHEPSNANYRDVEIPHIGCLPALVGL